MKRLLLGAAFAAICSSSSAAVFHPSVFVAGELGRTDFDVKDSDVPSITVDNGGGPVTYTGQVDDSDTARAFQLGFRPARHLAIEAGYANLGSLSISYPGLGQGSAEVKGFTLGADVLLPAYRQVTLFARAGLFHWKVDASARTRYGTGWDSEDGDDPYLGAGFLFGWDNLKFRAGYTRYDVDDDHADVVSAGLQYFFPAR